VRAVVLIRNRDGEAHRSRTSSHLARGRWSTGCRTATPQACVGPAAGGRGPEGTAGGSAAPWAAGSPLPAPSAGTRRAAAPEGQRPGSQCLTGIHGISSACVRIYYFLVLSSLCCAVKQWIHTNKECKQQKRPKQSVTQLAHMLSKRSILFEVDTNYIFHRYIFIPYMVFFFIILYLDDIYLYLYVFLSQ